MDLSTFLQRYRYHIKSAVSMAFVIGFFFAYQKVEPVNNIVNAALEPAIGGVTAVYSNLSTPLYRWTGINLGFVKDEPDPEFEFQVMLATYINDKNATPLVRLAVNTQVPDKKRIEALKALLKFERTEDWIQPFLNELYKGGMVGLYEPEFPLLEELMDRVRSEGGIQNSLVRAYAEVVFSFMVQVPEQPVLRAKALRWTNDLLAEDALFIIAPRIWDEEDEAVREALEKELIQTRAVSDHERAREELLRVFRNPPWPGIKVPAAVVLARTGFRTGGGYLRKNVDLDLFSDSDAGFIRVAMAETRYPRELTITKAAEIERQKRERARQEQYELALAKQAKIEKEERAKQREMELAKAEKVKEPAPVPPPPSPVKETAPAPVEKAPAPPQKPEAPEEKMEQMAKAEPAPPEPQPTPVEEETIVQKARKAEAKKTELRAQLGLRETGYIDIKFTAPGQPLPLYHAPGFDNRPMGLVIPRGGEGRATYRTLSKGRAWFYVRSGGRAGWTPGFLLSLQIPKQQPTSSAAKADTTFFRPAIHNAPLYEKTDESSKVLSRLDADSGYLSTESKKVGGMRWFFIRTDQSTGGWVRGVDLQLADIGEVSKVAVPVLE